MIKLFSFGVVLLYFLQPCYCLETLPVLVVDTGGVSVMGANVGNPFNKITKDVFSDMVKVIVSKASLTLIFVDNELSIEDISKRDSHGSPFRAFLKEMINDKKLLYLPSVIDPYNTLTSLLPASQENTLDFTTAKQKAKEFKPSSHVYIKFEPSAQPTVERLRIHDLAMRSIVRAARSNNNGSLVAFYTGTNNPLIIEQRRLPKIKNINEKSVFIASKKVLFRLSVEFEVTGLRLKQVDQAPVVSQETEEKSSVQGGNDKLSTTLSFTPFDLQFNFQLRKKDWVLDDITLIEAGEKVGHTKIGIGAPWRSSYHCAETMKIVNTRDQSAVILKRYQWQPSREICELTNKGCEDKNFQRSRLKLPIGNIKDLHQTKINVDDGKDIWGYRKKATTIHYDYDEINEAEGDHKTQEEIGKGSSGDHEYPSMKLKKNPGNAYIYGGDGEYKANEDAVTKMLSQKKNFETNRNADTEYGYDSEHKSSDDAKKGPFGQKKLFDDSNFYGYNKPKYVDIGHKKQYINKNINSAIHTHDVDGETFKNPFGDSLQLSKKHYIDNEPKTNKQEGQDHIRSEDTHKGHIQDKNRDDSSELQDEASSLSPKRKPRLEKPSPSGALSEKPERSTGSTKPSLPTQDLKFGSSVNCGPFFNHEVLSCLLVTFIIFIMLFYGLEIMLSLQANDRFDNFGGKNFSISEEK